MDEKVCFICLEESESKSDCDCKDRFVHHECLMQMIKKNHKTECPVCKINYKNIEIVNRTIYKPTILFPAYIFIILGNILLCVTWVILIITKSYNYENGRSIILFVAIIWISIFVISVISLHVFVSEGYKCIKSIPDVDIVMNQA